MPRGNPTPVRSVRVSDALWARLQVIADLHGATRSDVIAVALERYERYERRHEQRKR